MAKIVAIYPTTLHHGHLGKGRPGWEHVEPLVEVRRAVGPQILAELAPDPGTWCDHQDATRAHRKWRDTDQPGLTASHRKHEADLKRAVVVGEMVPNMGPALALRSTQAAVVDDRELVTIGQEGPPEVAQRSLSVAQDSAASRSARRAGRECQRATMCTGLASGRPEGERAPWSCVYDRAESCASCAESGERRQAPPALVLGAGRDQLLTTYHPPPDASKMPSHGRADRDRFSLHVGRWGNGNSTEVAVALPGSAPSRLLDIALGESRAPLDSVVDDPVVRPALLGRIADRGAEADRHAVASEYPGRGM